MSTQNRSLVFVGGLFLTAYFCALAGLVSPENVHPLWNAAIGVFLMCLAGFGIENTKSLLLTFGKRFSVGLQTERYEPTTEEEAVAVKVSADTLKPGEERQRDRLVEAAESRSADERSAADLLVLSTEAWRSKALEASVRLAYEGLVLSPKDVRLSASLRHRLASVYADLGARELAEGLYRQAIAEDPTFSWPHNNLGLLLAKSGRNEEAEKEYREAISLDPTDALAHINLGTLLAKSGRDEEAEKEYREAISLDPTDVAAHNNLGLLLAKSGRNEEAEKEYREAVSLDPTDAMAHINLGVLLAKVGRDEEAEKEFREAISLDPTNALAHNNLGALLAKSGRNEEAEKEFREAVSLDPTNGTAKRNLDRLLKVADEN